MSIILENYRIELGAYDLKQVIWFYFANDLKLRNELKSAFPSARWSPAQKAWYIADTKQNRIALQIEVNDVMSCILHKINLVNRAAFKRFIEQLKLKAYSENTIRTYGAEFAQLLYLLKSHAVDSLTTERLRAYILYCINALDLSENQLHSRLNALKFYFEQVLHREKFFIDIPRPKKKSILPKVLSKKEIVRLLNSTENLKHLMLLKCCYGMGLRVSEVVNLKLSNIDTERMQVHIESAKGKKDRYLPLPESIVDELRTYYRQYKPNLFLFEGQIGGQYSTRSVQAVFKAAMHKAGIKKQIGIHGLRHSYATHLLEYGTDMVFIQKLLGHANVKTTEIYAKVSNRQLNKIKSPLDRE